MVLAPAAAAAAAALSYNGFQTLRKHHNMNGKHNTPHKYHRQMPHKERSRAGTRVKGGMTYFKFGNRPFLQVSLYIVGATTTVYNMISYG